VPNLLSSQDKFLNQLGVEEYELYSARQVEDGGWKVDQQQGSSSNRRDCQMVPEEEVIRESTAPAEERLASP